jgi:hypothetical protein
VGKQIRASALLASFAAGASVHAGIITDVDPFTGDLSESWESFANSDDLGGYYASGTSIMDGAGAIWGNALYVYEPGVAPFLLAAGIEAGTMDGTRAMGADIDGAATSITFDTPVTMFGAYWGAQSTWIDLIFFDAGDSIINFASIDYNAVDEAGALAWHGWSSDTPIARIEYVGDYVAIDALQAMPLPGPGAVFILASAVVFASRRRRD